MATTYTENYHLGKQENTADKFDMSVITDNMDAIDHYLKTNANAISDIADRLSASIDDVRDSVGALESTVAYKSELDRAEDTIDTLYATISDLRGQVGALETSLGLLTDRVEALEGGGE